MREHGPEGWVQVQLVPLIEVAVNPETGKVSVTVTVSPDRTGPGPALLTVMVYCAPVWPWKKLPLWALSIVRSGAWTMVVGSLAELLLVTTSPPLPAVTVAVFVKGVPALLATLTVKVIVG